MLLIPLRLGLTDINEAYVETLKVGLGSALTPALPLPALCALSQLQGRVHSQFTRGWL